MPNVGVLYLMIYLDNEQDCVVPDLFRIRLRQLASSYWIVSFSMFKLLSRNTILY